MTQIQIPKFNDKFVCIVNRDDTVLAALISSYIITPGEYLCMFEYPRVYIHSDETDKDLIRINTITKERSEAFNIFILNTLNIKEHSKYIVLAGLDENQKSYLTFLENYTIIEIQTIDEVDFSLKEIVCKNRYLYCKKEDIYNGLYQAALENLILNIDDNSKDIILIQI